MEKPEAKQNSSVWTMLKQMQSVPIAVFYAFPLQATMVGLSSPWQFVKTITFINHMLKSSKMCAVASTKVYIILVLHFCTVTNPSATPRRIKEEALLYGTAY